MSYNTSKLMRFSASKANQKPSFFDIQCRYSEEMLSALNRRTKVKSQCHNSQSTIKLYLEVETREHSLLQDNNTDWGIIWLVSHRDKMQFSIGTLNIHNVSA